MEATLRCEGTVVAPGDRVRLESGHVWPLGATVAVSLKPEASPRAGSKAALLELLESPSRVAAEDVEELRRAIAEGKRDADWAGRRGLDCQWVEPPLGGQQLVHFAMSRRCFVRGAAATSALSGTGGRAAVAQEEIRVADAVTATQQALERKVARILERGRGTPVLDSPPALYLYLAEQIARQATEWQQPDGMVGDPYNEPGVESVTGTARYTAAMGSLLAAGRCRDLLAPAMKAMDWCCEQLWSNLRAGKKWQCSVFNVKDMMVLYGAAKPQPSPARAPARTLAQNRVGR